MVRSNFALTRILFIPYGVLLALYLAVVGGGGSWLYLEVRAVETRLLMKELGALIGPFAERLRAGDALASMREQQARWTAEIEALFVTEPALRHVSLRGTDAGFRVDNTGSGRAAVQLAPPLAEDTRPATADDSADVRLYSEAGALFVLHFDMTPVGSPLVRLDFAFDRLMLLNRIESGVASIKRSILLFGVAGVASIVIALGITLIAMRTTRKLEGYFQEMYQRASLTETAAQLVHDLRNPLAALRANVKALLLSPAQIPQIVEELDRDIVTLNDKLSGFLDLTRQRDERTVSVDIAALIDDAVRLAEPVLSRHGLTAQVTVMPGLPRPHWQAASVRDALLNVIINAAQSGQQQGAIEVTAQMQDEVVEISVEDHGRGIPEAAMPRLFDAFFTTRDDGTGLGLAIVRRIVTAHQGWVRAQNRAAGGARVVLCLPLQRKEPPHWWKRLKKPFPT